MTTIIGTTGNDTLVGVNAEPNTIYGDTGAIADPSTPVGNDTLTGGANSTNNTIYGDADTLMGAGSTGGDDTLIGGVNSTNYLYGDSNHMQGAPTGGKDTLIGGTGGTNYLIGDAADFNGSPTGGDDRLVSASSTTDHMWGDFQSATGGAPGFGEDTFVFSPDSGDDFIYDFHQGEDTIELEGFAHPIPQAALAAMPEQTAIRLLEVRAGVTYETDGGDTVVSFETGDSVTVYDVELTPADFDFVI